MIGIDLGGTKIEIIALADDGSILLQRRVPTPQNQYRRTLETIAQLVREAETSLGRAATVGIGLPGSLSPFDGKMRNANSVCLNGQPLREDIESLLDRRVSITNDANCFALSEATDGAATGAGSVFGVIVGAGTGAGLVVESKVLDGCNGVAGEWGHNPLPWPRPDELPGPACWCGQRGRLETWLSGPGLARDHEEQTGAKGLTARAIAEAEARGDPAATETLERYETCLARGLSHIINIFDPEVIVLGGGISNIQRLYIPLAPKNTPFRARRFLSRARRKNAGIVALRQVFTTQLSTKRCVA
ncbi:MAG TPA: ROK family protein [Gammaproteobacteria bacterium]|nr:ROK family protein [Gammaproteobacteria bacterium]